MAPAMVPAIEYEREGRCMVTSGWTGRWWVAVGLLLVMGCGSEIRDRPQDCRENQYFDESQRRCRTCPAVQEPECRPGCELEVGEDQRGCPVLRCEPLCQGCEVGEVWDGELEACVKEESPGDEPDAGSSDAGEDAGEDAGDASDGL